MENEVCGTCRYFWAQRGVCRRYPPTVTALVMTEEYTYGDNYRHAEREAISVSSNFPATNVEDWCGEWTGDE